jgi:predicted nucleotidyltransferase
VYDLEDKMVQLIKEHFGQIEELCHKYSVKRLEVFGSAVHEEKFDAGKKSDLDFLVEFDELEPGENAKTYFGFLFALQNLFGREVDLVMPEAIRNRYFLESINREREVLYAA